jgi:biopolymer transport protein ExbD
MKRKHRRLRQEADLDITAFMNLMIVLVPILLINMIFASTSVLELNFPTQDNDQALENELVQLQVIITPEQLLVADNKGGVIKQIDSKDGAYDFEMLGLVMQDLKARVPEKKDITVMAMKKTSYQTLVSVMDKVRSYPAVVAGSLVHAELFPEVSIADAPESLNIDQESVVLNNSNEKEPELTQKASQDELKVKS